ncbi:TetR/AcrR family transcriptional regulator [Nocardioides sp.]|uniref:TetR/AcrR family transcriptional regulator n=1 Tax=Nocardioides sp. TaxID=35761 RepID=UPI0039E5B055
MDLSLRPLATAIGSSPRVLMFLFGSKDGLVRALLDRARTDELRLLDGLRGVADASSFGLADALEQVWAWLADERHRALLRLWVEAYSRSLIEPEGAWAGFAQGTVREWLGVLAEFQPAHERELAAAQSQRTLALAVLRGGLLDLLATGDEERVGTAVALRLGELRGVIRHGSSSFPSVGGGPG